MEVSRLQSMLKLTLWCSFFPIDILKVLGFLKVVVDRIFDFGMCLGAPYEFLQMLEASDVEKRKRELMTWWMGSSQDPPCWWRLTEALRDAERSTLADDIKKEHGKSG